MVQTYLHCKLHLTDEQHSVSAFTPPASCLALHYQQWGEKQHFLLHYPCYSLFTYQLFWNVALIWNSFQDTKQHYEWKHTQNKINYSRKMPSRMEKIMVLSGNFQTWEESSFTVSGSVTRAFWKQQGCPLLLNQPKTTKNSSNFICHQHHQECSSEYVCLCFLSMSGCVWLMVVGHSRWLSGSAQTQLFWTNSLFVLPNPHLLWPEDLISLHHLPGTRTQACTCPHALHVPTSRHTSTEQREIKDSVRNMVMYCWLWRFQ